MFHESTRDPREREWDRDCVRWLPGWTSLNRCWRPRGTGLPPAPGRNCIVDGDDWRRADDSADDDRYDGAGLWWATCGDPTTAGDSMVGVGLDAMRAASRRSRGSTGDGDRVGDRGGSLPGDPAGDRACGDLSGDCAFARDGDGDRDRVGDGDRDRDRGNGGFDVGWPCGFHRGGDARECECEWGCACVGDMYAGAPGDNDRDRGCRTTVTGVPGGATVGVDTRVVLGGDKLRW